MHANHCKSSLHVLLEADGPLVLMAYTKITSTAHNTNTHAVESGGVDQMEQQLHVLAWPFLCSPVDRISKRGSKVTLLLLWLLSSLHACFSPTSELKSTSSDVDCLNVFKF